MIRLIDWVGRLVPFFRPASAAMSGISHRGAAGFVELSPISLKRLPPGILTMTILIIGFYSTSITK